MKELGELPAAVAHQVISYLECVETSEAAEDMSRHGYSCDDVWSKDARRFKRLQDEELSRMKARGEL